jgi:hypothetical protein
MSRPVRGRRACESFAGLGACRPCGDANERAATWHDRPRPDVFQLPWEPFRGTEMLAALTGADSITWLRRVNWRTWKVVQIGWIVREGACVTNVSLERR